MMSYEQVQCRKGLFSLREMNCGRLFLELIMQMLLALNGFIRMNSNKSK